MPELLGRREIGLPSTGAKKIELIVKHVHAREKVCERVCSRLYMYCVILVTTGQ